MRNWSIAAVVVVAAVMAILGLTRTARGARHPNILLITLDTTRADHLGAYGYAGARTPRLDRLAAEGVRFERTIASAPLTLPSHASILSGRFPPHHGVRNNGGFTFPPNIPTLATALKQGGYRTGAFVSAFVLDRRFGLATGFDEYDDHVAPAVDRESADLERRGDRTAAAANEWLSHNAAAAPFFAWIHLYDAHDPYEPPSPYREQFAERPYDGEIAFDDEVIGSVLDRLANLGVLDSTVVAVVGDHGESLGEHGEATHGLFVYDATLRVPMLIRWPARLPSAAIVSAPARTVDLAPTLIALAGVQPLSGVDGVSLADAIQSSARRPPDSNGAAPRTTMAGAPSEGAYAETYFPLYYMNWAPLRSLQDENWKYIDAPEPELYDLRNDPHEQRNLVTREPARASALAHALDAVAGQQPPSAAALDRETAQKLAALGYVSPTIVPRSADAGSRPDPKAMIGVFNRLRDANAALHRGDATRAAAAAREVLVSDGDNAFARVILARSQLALGQHAEALANFRLYLAAVPTSADAHHWMAICYERLQQDERAIAEEDAALAIDPRFGDALFLKGGVLALAGRTEEAITAIRGAIAVMPDKAAYHAGLARVLADNGREKEARTEYDRALALDPGNPDARAALRRPD